MKDDDGAYKLIRCQGCKELHPLYEYGIKWVSRKNARTSTEIMEPVGTTCRACQEKNHNRTMFKVVFDPSGDFPRGAAFSAYEVAFMLRAGSLDYGTVLCRDSTTLTVENAQPLGWAVDETGVRYIGQSHSLRKVTP